MMTQASVKTNALVADMVATKGPPCMKRCQLVSRLASQTYVYLTNGVYTVSTDASPTELVSIAERGRDNENPGQPHCTL